MPMPRLEVRDVEDLKVLHEIGVLQPDHTIELASILLGNFKKMRKRPASVLGEGVAGEGGSGSAMSAGGPNKKEEKGDVGTPDENKKK
jgi:hypothetical protein